MIEEPLEIRVARLEERTALIPEMRDDLKTVVAYVNQQKGKATMLGMVWAGLAAVIGALVDKLWHR